MVEGGIIEEVEAVEGVLAVDGGGAAIYDDVLVFEGEVFFADDGQGEIAKVDLV